MRLRVSSRYARSWVDRLAWVCVLAAGLVGTAHADEASGTWTGQVEGRPNYFLERSTRVIMPAGRVSLEAPNGVRMHAEYLVDIISSASIAQTGGGKDGVFTELRHAVNLGGGKRISIGDEDLDLSAHAIFSTEPDYKSWIYGVRASYAFNERNSTLSLGVSGVSDTVLSDADPTFKKHLDGVTTSLGFVQLLSPVMMLSLGYQFVALNGFLGNAYRKVLIGPLPHPEAPPDTRLRHNAEGQLSWFLPHSQTTLQLYMRLYIDSWQLGALTPELRVYQQLSAAVVGRLRYRFYDQTKADYALDSGETRYPVGYTGPVTSDPKMSAFHSHQIGVKFDFALAALGGTVMDFARSVVLDISFDYQWCTSSFGNNIIATAGGRIPF
jgi:hypothetical protein